MESAMEVGTAKRRKIEEDKQKAEDIRMKAMEKIGETRKRKEESAGNEGMPVKKSRRGSKDTIEFLQEKSERDFALIKGERIGAKKDGTGAEFAENQPISAAAKSDAADYATANETTIRHDDGFHEKVSVINAEEHNCME